ncbi:uncharacterized protein LOC109857608 [Pseudomyrmex gracilis]|uniref:uncharacterized protein LOC109857608 n=1 Tax=Pseudomyrmex gracilis TaxID=219809 RepID=UPI0009956645|nr:uncharacterized protein LOC109857608 [Pseudomyrmex gracilis]
MWSVRDRTSLETATVERLQAEAKRFQLPTTGTRDELFERILSHLERVGPQDLMAESQGTLASSLPGDSGAGAELEEPLTANLLRSSLSEMTEVMRQQQQSIQMLIQHLTASTAPRAQTSTNDFIPVVVADESRAVARSPSSEGRSGRQTECNIPGNAVSWLATQIPEYGGTEDQCIKNWVNRVDQVAAVHGASDGVTLLAATSKLIKFAKTWYESQSGASIQSWIGLRQRMFIVFARKIPMFKAVQKAEARKWIPAKETFDQYAIAKNALINQLGLPAEDTIQMLISGITNTAVRASALLIADSTLEHFMVKMRGLTEGLSDSVEKKSASVSTLDKKLNPVCRNCNKKGHTHKDCKNDVVCFYCKQKGHRQFDCPTLKEKNGKPQQSKRPASVAAPVTEVAAGVEVVALVNEKEVDLQLADPLVK